MTLCPHAPPCGGCPHLALPYEESLRLKRERVAEAVSRFPALSGVAPSACVAAPSRTGHRTRVKAPVAVGADGRVRIGLYAPGSHELLDLPECQVVAAPLLAVAAALRELLVGFAPPIGHVDLRASRSTGLVHVTLVSRGPVVDEDGLRALAARLLERRPEVRGVSLRRSVDAPTPRAVAGRTACLVGEPQLEERLAGRRFRLSPGSFFQADPAAAEELHRIVRGFLAPLAPMRTLVDLFAGVGAFGICLADLAARVVAVESVREAADDAAASAALSGVGLEVEPLPSERFAERLRDLAPDAVIADPPRRGLDARTIEAIGGSGARRVAYASCDPETLARDLAALAPFDLVCAEIAPVDLFALSDRVEAAALLVREPGAFSPRIFWRGGDLIAVEKPWILPTTPQEGNAPSLTGLVRRAEGDDAWSPAHRLDVGASGPVLFARGRELGRIGGAFSRGEVEKEYLALVRGVPRGKGKVATRATRELGGGEERTRYRREAVVGGYGLVRALPETGERHQIRRHLERIGHPILGDERHGDPRANRWMIERAALDRLFLHLERLRFPAPSGEIVEVVVPLPPELELVLDRLERLRSATSGC
ncbi:MAG: pseudouridine synthase [Proteobacteria bacterium]|jgi:23S rRNA (uracil1939-C5)-methyltransferase|nr:pseudouridine synthase [Pseudomonadota bacterium]